MNLLNIVGTGQDLQNGAFITLNGKQWKESFEDLIQAAQKANSIDITKGETLLAWATGNFNTDYDFAKNFQTDAEALENFIKKYQDKNYKYYKDKEDAINDVLKNSSTILQDFVKNADDAKISVTEFFKSVTGAGALETAIEGIGLQILATAGQVAAIWLVGEAIRFVWTELNNLIHAGEIAREKMEESTKAYTAISMAIGYVCCSGYIVFADRFFDMLEGTFQLSMLQTWIPMAITTVIVCMVLSLWPFIIGMIRKSVPVTIVMSLIVIVFRQVMITKNTTNQESILQILFVAIVTGVATVLIFKRKVPELY